MLELQQYDAAGQQDTSSYQPFCMGPSALGVDDAISALQESVDWMRLRSYALPGGTHSPTQEAVSDRQNISVTAALFSARDYHLVQVEFLACEQVGP